MLLIKKIIGIALAIILFAVVTVPTINYYDGEKTLEVYVLAGQSNSAYSIKEERCDAEYVNENVPSPDTTLWYYGTEEMPIRNGISGSTPSDYDTTFESYDLWKMYRNGEWIIGGVEPTLALEISEHTDSDVLIVNAGVDNQTIARLLPTSTHGQYVAEVLSHAFAHIDHEKYTTVNYRGVVWIQGESDNVEGTTVESYVEDFTTLKAWYSEQGFNQWYIVQIRPLNSDNAAIAQSQIANEYDDVHLTDVARSFTTSNGLMNSDNIHYTQEGRCLVGYAVGDMTPFSPHLRGDAISLIWILPVIIVIGIGVGALSLIRQRDE